MDSVFPRSIDPEVLRGALRRGLVVALIALLHIALIWLLLSTDVVHESPLSRVREIILSLSRSPSPNTTTPRPHAAQALPQSAEPHSIVYPPLPASPPDISGLGRDLFGCDLSELSNMSAAERAHCRNAATAIQPNPDVGAPLLRVSHSMERARWAASMAARKRPERAPCVGLQQNHYGIGGGTTETVAMADPLCALRTVIKGR